jgi:cytochrome c551/c552
LEAKVSEHKPSRWLYPLTAGVLLLGTLLVAVGTRNDDSTQANDGRQNRGLDEGCRLSSGTPVLMERGAIVQRMECAGCHSDDRREIGPSYEVIAARYHCRPDELIAAIGHPKPGWADYPPGPAGPPLPRDDQAALVYWILNAGGSGDE